MKKPGPRIWLEPVATSEGVLASFVVRLAGLPVGKKLSLDFYEVDPPAGKKRDEKRNQTKGDVSLGTVRGEVAPALLATKMSGVPSFTLKPEPGAVAPPKSAPVVEFMFAESPVPYRFRIPEEALDLDEGDFWEIQVRAQTPKMASPVMTIAHVRRALEGPHYPYKWHEGHKLTTYHDGATDPEGNGGAFADMKKAIAAAEKFVFVVDWSFHPFFNFKQDSDHSLENTIGSLLLRKANDGVTVAIHTWNHTNIAAKDSQNDSADSWFHALAEHFGLAAHPKTFCWRAGSPSGIFYSHHQKFVIVDQPAQDKSRRSFRVFWGGLDVTQGRHDWSEHPSSANDSRLANRRMSWGTSHNYLTNEWYNGETGGALDLPREPWHDIYGNVEGPATWDFLREFVIRWCSHKGSTNGDELQKSGDPVCEIWNAVRDRSKWVQADEPFEGPWAAQVLRSNTDARCGVAEQFLPLDARPLNEALPASFESSILDMYRQAIDQADRFIYIENQYVIGSGAHWDRSSIGNDLPERIVKKILSKKGQPFHVYIVIPMLPEGDPVSTGMVEVRNYEWRTLQYMVKQLHDAVGSDWSKYLTPLFLADWHQVAQKEWSTDKDRNGRLRAHQRYMVYVHSKLIIVDDRFILFGSANLNERSLAGNRDTEIACALWPGRNQEKVCIDELRAFRKQLFTEHFGKVPADDAASSECVRACQEVADANYVSFRRMAAERQGHACRLPVQLDAKGQIKVGELQQQPKTPLAFPERLVYVPDAGKGDWWLWTCRGSRLSLMLMDIAE
jgi:phosphatidylserine/phosphatidylglycerophosphate/cardiolipin synthase-like enzyme